MFIRKKLITILNRLSYVFKNDIKGTFPEQYSQGFRHAFLLFKIAFDTEFGDYTQIETNKRLELKEKDKEIEKLNDTVKSKQRFIDHLEGLILQTNTKQLSNTQRKKIIRAICSLTGQQYEVIRDEFDSILGIRKGELND